MSPSLNQRHEAQRRVLEEADQGQVLRFWDQLGEAARSGLLDQLEKLDLELIAELGNLVAQPAGDGHVASFEPPEVFPLERDAPTRARAAAAVQRGQELLGAGSVAYLLVAGGQGSRLGLDGPKGAFELGPLSGRTLFEVHARRLLAARRRWGAGVPWYVMTSPANDAETRALFESNGHYGLDPADVFFFSQAMLPALDLEGRILLAGPGELFLAPNGHGGVLSALRDSGALADMRRRGITTLSYFQVDNPLARPADPLFLGLHELEGAGMSSKVVAKRDASEKVGVLGRVDGQMGCIEYSDLPDEQREARAEGGALLFNAGNIAVHALRVDFIDELTRGKLQLPWHVARKQIKTLDAAGAPCEVPGVKFETFVFDAMGRSERCVTLEVDRGLEFSPVKNASGEDSPASTRRDLCRLHAAWVRAAGTELPEARLEGQPLVEIDPLLAESEGEFLAAERPAPRIVDGGHLYEVSGR